MSSREIAELTGKELKNVNRDIRTLLITLGQEDGSVLNHVREDKDSRGYTVNFHLPKDPDYHAGLRLFGPYVPPHRDPVAGTGAAATGRNPEGPLYAYAMWISPKFHIQVIRAYDAMVSRPAPAEPRGPSAGRRP